MNRRGFLVGALCAPIAAALPAVAGRAAISPEAGELIVEGAIKADKLQISSPTIISSCPSCGKTSACNCVTASNLSVGSVTTASLPTGYVDAPIVTSRTVRS